jgi:stage V sporulation protein SpoVS
MKKIGVVLSTIALSVAASGCYHASVDTGLTPNGVVVEKAWAHSFIGGLVPPSTVETAAQCPNGVAKVETQLSFLNMLANALTGGIYSPMTITVQCAGATALNADAEVIRVAKGQSEEAALNAAVALSRDSDAPVFVQFAE